MPPSQEFTWRCLLHSLPKPSPERLRVVEHVFDLPEPFQAEDVVQLFTGESPRISRSTIYRTLTMLVSVEMLEKEGDDFYRQNSMEGDIGPE